ncbi:uncharacterized protein LOC129968250 [Argiope bruennichi]|uniref:uncharacterized protein LOC129968250 n=1 Tax=Argiope bruennichi TaxID=94029 RepID=UPI002494795A|nr:uncharacterized protein LOC129968250 [Argiope bruennichi]
MSSRRETTESERLLVVKWSKEGKSLREIASLIGVFHGCVQKILQKYKKTGSVANIPGRGRKETLSTTAKRKIIHSVKKDRLTLHQYGFNGRTPIRKPLINNGRFKIWREAGKALAPKNTIKTVKFGGGSVLVWGCMAAGGVGELAFIDAQSPDLNVIENLWSQLEKAVHEHEITSKEVLKKVRRGEWVKFSVETAKTLVESLPRRLQAVIQAKGYATKY